MATLSGTAAVAATPSTSGRWRRRLAGYPYVLPAVLVVLVVMAYPFFYSIYLSFRTTDQFSVSTSFGGFHNYSRLLHDAVFGRSLVNTVVWTFGSTVLDVLLGLGAAVLVNNVRWLKGLVRAALMLPYIVGYVIASYAWLWLYQGEYGFLNQALLAMGITHSPVNFLSSLTWAMPAVILANVWKTFPFAMIMLLAGLQGIPEHTVLAARLDRASHWRVFWEVKIPYIRPVLVITALLLVFQNFNTFTIPFIMTKGGPLNHTQIASNYIYDKAFTDSDFGMAAAGSVIVMLILMCFAFFYLRGVGGQEARR